VTGTESGKYPGGAPGTTKSRVPDFFMIGVPRSGTTSLYHALQGHPAIFMPALKEVCFTCPELDPGTHRTQSRYFTDRADYLSLFAGARSDQLVGEGCIYNVYSQEAPRRIHELNPEARLIIQLRDPIEQMRSNHALKLIMLDLSDDDFGRTLKAQASVRVAGQPPPVNMRDYDLRDKATVSSGVERFIAEFGRDRLHVSLYEDYALDPQATIRSTLRFLGLNEQFEPKVVRMVPNRRARWDRLNRAMGAPRLVDAAKRLVPQRLHSRVRRVVEVGFGANRKVVARGPIDPQLLASLRDEFRPEVERLGELVGRDLLARWWGEGAAARFSAPVRAVSASG
jgi:hypothetical protein